MSTTQPETQAPPPRPPRGRIERSRDERVVAGVCGGLARHLDIDPLLVRILAVASIVFAGFGVVAYVAAWLLMPEEGEQRPIIGTGRANRAVQVGGAVALGVIAIVAIASWANGSWWFGGGPLVIFILAIAVVWFLSDRDRRPAFAAPTTMTMAVPAERHETVAGSDVADAEDPTLVDNSFVAGHGGPGGPDAPPRRRRNARRPLIVLAIVFAAGIAAAGALGTWLVLDGGVGTRSYRVADGDSLRPKYELGAGHLRLDVRDIALAKGTTHVDANLHAGLLEIVAPNARFADGPGVGADSDAGGIDVDRTIVVGSGDRALEIDAHVGAGDIEISDQPSDMSDWTVSDAAPGCGSLGFALLRPGCAASGAA